MEPASPAGIERHERHLVAKEMTLTKAEGASKPVASGTQDEMLEEYDFSAGVRGKYAERMVQGSNVVLLDADVAEVFHTGDLLAFYYRWKVAELAVFGSILRSDFHANSDIDLLVTFSPDAQWTLLDHIRMEDELGQLLGRKVDMSTRRAVERSANWLRRREILDTAQMVYSAEGEAREP